MASALDGLVFVVTGGGRGLGREIATTAAAQGARVVVADQDADAGQRTAGEIISAGGDAVAQNCDVTVEDEIADLMARAVHEFGGIDTLVNNAGVHERALHADPSFETLPVAVFDKVLAVNLRGAWLCAQSALPHLRRSSNASIINAGSTAGLTGWVGSTAYGPSKGGIVLLTKDLAVDLAPFGIRVNCYCPGAMETRMVLDHLSAQPDPEAALAHQISTHLVHRLGRPADVANLVCFLASTAASFITGEAIRVDGGSLAWRGTRDHENAQKDLSTHPEGAK